MFSICVKFKEELNWRPYCRQFDSLDAAKAALDDAFKKWSVHHASIFEDGVFLNCYWFSPSLTASLRRSAENLRQKRYQLYGNFKNH